MTLWVDGDACPDLSDIVALCQHYQVGIKIICDDAHEFPEKFPVITVPSGSQNTDLYLINHIHEKDFVITGDYGVASHSLLKDCTVLHPSGMFYTKENIDLLLWRRHLHTKLRRQNKKTPNMKKRTKEDRNYFLSQVETVLKGSVSNENRH